MSSERHKLYFFRVFIHTDTFRVIWRFPAFTGGGRPETHKYLHVWVEAPTHRRSAGRPPHMKVFATTGTRTHAVRGRCDLKASVPCGPHVLDRHEEMKINIKERPPDNKNSVPYLAVLALATCKRYRKVANYI